MAERNAYEIALDRSCTQLEDVLNANELSIENLERLIVSKRLNKQKFRLQQALFPTILFS